MPYSFHHRPLAMSLLAALEQDPFYATLRNKISPSKDPDEAMLAYLDYSICEAETFGEVFVPKEREIGVSVWSKPIDAQQSKRKSELKKAFLTDELGHEALETYLAITRFMTDAGADFLKEDWWYLSILGIHPQFQGQGLGSTLLTPVLDKADALNTTTYLETFTPRNMSFYQRLGFEELASIHEPTTQSDYAIMARKPR